MALEIPADIATCPSLEACLRLLDSVVPARSDGNGSGGEVLAQSLRRFGDPAKQELLRRAGGDHSGWRNLAGAILMYWGSWEPADVPALAAALEKSPGGWVARPLGEIGTPDAIRALVAGLSSGGMDQTDAALSLLGDKALPFLFPLLQDAKRAQSAARVIAAMDGAAAPAAPGWAALAINPRQPLAVRLAALRGIAAIGDRAKSSGGSITGLLNDPDAQIRTQARATLRAIRDPVAVEELAASCRPTATPFDPFALDAFTCLLEIARFGEDGREAGPYLLPFLASQNPAERKTAIATLGMIGDGDAIPEIEAQLGSADWRIVYASLRSLGWLGARQSSTRIEETRRRHWLPEIRQAAARVLEAFRSPEGRLSRPSGFGISRGVDHAFMSFDIDAQALDPAPNCPGDRWRWEQRVFKTPGSDGRRDAFPRNRLRLWEGWLTGTNAGEWGGALTWQADDGAPQTIHKDNVVGIAQDGDKAIALFGLAHMSLDYGYALSIGRAPDGAWSLTEIARLPGAPAALVTIGGGLFAAPSAGRVVVFSAQGILGLARCATPP